MIGYHADLETETKKNGYYRKSLFTGKYLQLVLMTLQPGEEVGMEVHPDKDQFFRIEEGTGQAILNGEVFNFKDGDGIIVPAGTRHNIINNSDKVLKFYTIYSTPDHEIGTLEETKADEKK